MVFPVVMYGYESWTIKKAECQELMLLNCGVGEDSWESLGLQEIQPVHPKGNQSWIFIEGLMLKLKLQYFGHLIQRTDYLKRPWCWERLKAGGEGDDRGWDGWMASQTLWVWVWVSSGNWWWTGTCWMDSRVCCSPWDHKESDMTEQLNWTDWRPF